MPLGEEQEQKENNMPTTFPQDKNTYAITDTVIRQTECQYKFGKKSGEFSLRFMGDAADATLLASSYREGSRVAFNDLKTDFKDLSAVNSGQFETHGKVVSSIAQTKKGCATATVTISIPYDSKINPVISSLNDYKIVTWAERSTKHQFGLEVYSGEISSDSNEYASAGDYEGWLNENGSHTELYKAFKYSLTDGTTVDLSARTLDLAKKRYANIQSVERGYPEVIRTTRYYYLKGDDVSADYQIINKIDEDPKLYEIDDTPNKVWKSKFDGFSWLKTGYDVETQETEYEHYWNATVTESWTGINIEERGEWDKNLYGVVGGNDRWAFYTKALSGS